MQPSPLRKHKGPVCGMRNQLTQAEIPHLQDGDGIGENELHAIQLLFWQSNSGRGLNNFYLERAFLSQSEHSLLTQTGRSEGLQTKQGSKSARFIPIGSSPT